MSPVLPDKFLDKIIKSETGCWLWQGTLFRGYGKFCINGRGATAHRWSYEFHHGPVPEKLYVLHKCDVRNCVNPDHLYAGDAFQNRMDCVMRNRWRERSATHCINGHEYTPETTYWRTCEGRRQSRRCRICHAVISKRSRLKGAQNVT